MPATQDKHCERHHLTPVSPSGGLDTFHMELKSNDECYRMEREAEPVTKVIELSAYALCILIQANAH